MKNRWPLWGIAAVVLIESRGLLTTTPEITENHLRSLPPSITDQFSQHQGDLLIGGGLSLLGIFCLVVFLTCLAGLLSVRMRSGSPVPSMVLVGAAVTGGA